MCLSQYSTSMRFWVIELLYVKVYWKICWTVLSSPTSSLSLYPKNIKPSSIQSEQWVFSHDWKETILILKCNLSLNSQMCCAVHCFKLESCSHELNSDCKFNKTKVKWQWGMRFQNEYLQLSTWFPSFVSWFL